MAGKPAARVGDMTAHGSPLSIGPGSMNVFIGKKPAWRGITDIHTCPVVKGTGPDGVGVVIDGSTTVLINGLPACRIGDTIQETTSVNKIVAGEFTVMIGG